MKLRTPFLALVACGALALPGCGDDSEPSVKPTTKPAPQASAPPPANARAIQEIAATRRGLEQALKQVRAGDAKVAEETVSETYLKHFELVEGPLDKVDHELNEELEHTIREDLRKKIADGGTPAEVEKLVDEIGAGLDTAEAKLQ
jgi:hypothetical protein